MKKSAQFTRRSILKGGATLAAATLVAVPTVALAPSFTAAEILHMRAERVIGKYLSHGIVLVCRDGRLVGKYFYVDGGLTEGESEVEAKLDKEMRADPVLAAKVIQIAVAYTPLLSPARRGLADLDGPLSELSTAARKETSCQLSVKGAKDDISSAF
ncbi:twin-arginine translocation signal domain-containing protein [Microvirga antarctica]|uniref:twin-arginine translocation signal domain-containing protein n=1 Tax=Microvirga antarctica TaxID=2819233 RepID=UPI001B3002A7|nr:twin-arginine translocation signal domain-containing protein [Microvirga antarctica]